jgi:hypothetical protein
VSSFTGRRFANPERTDVLPLGPCQCPGSPHEQDEYVHRLELGAGEEQRAGDAGWAEGGYATFSSAAAQNKLIEIAGKSWNLVDGECDCPKNGHRGPVHPDGEPVPLTAYTASLLDEDTRRLITTRLDEVTAGGNGKDPPDGKAPNASGARSGRSTRASASRTRMTRKKR